MGRNRDIVVVGGGLCGVATALALKVASMDHREVGPRVVLVNDGRLGHASASAYNGGTIHSGASYALGRTYKNDREAEACRSAASLVDSLLPRSCVISDESWYLVNRDGIAQYEAKLGALDVRHQRCSATELLDVLRPQKRQETGCILVEELQIDTSETMQRFTQACRDAGVELVLGEPVEAIVQNRFGSTAGVRLGNGRVLPAGQVVICAGRGTADLLRTLTRPPNHALRHIHRHNSLYVEISQSKLTRSTRGVEMGFPVVTQLRDRQSISLYGMPPYARVHEAFREVVRVFQSWFLSGTFDLDDPLVVTTAEKVEFHSPHLARSTLPRVLGYEDLGVDNLFCILPGKISHAMSMALSMPLIAGVGGGVLPERLFDRLSCAVERSTQKLLADDGEVGLAAGN